MPHAIVFLLSKKLLFNFKRESYLSLVNSDGPTHTAGLSTHFVAFAVYLEYTGSVTTYK